MRIIKMAEAKLKDYKAYLVIITGQYVAHPTKDLKETIEQTSDLIEILEEDLEACK